MGGKVSGSVTKLFGIILYLHINEEAYIQLCGKSSFDEGQVHANLLDDFSFLQSIVKIGELK